MDVDAFDRLFRHQADGADFIQQGLVLDEPCFCDLCVPRGFASEVLFQFIREFDAFGLGNGGEAFGKLQPLEKSVPLGRHVFAGDRQLGVAFQKALEQGVRESAEFLGAGLILRVL